MHGRGLFACPLRWFTEIGGLDLAYRTWGYEDHDLHSRAEQALPLREIPWREALLLHQWHPPSAEAGPAKDNRDYCERMRRERVVVRNAGRLVPAPAVPRRARVVSRDQCLAFEQAQDFRFGLLSDIEIPAGVDAPRPGAV